MYRNIERLELLDAKLAPPHPLLRRLSSGFALDLLRKDLNAALQSARELGSPSFAGALAQQLYALVAAQEGGRLDYSVVAKLYESAAGVGLRLQSEK